MQNISLRLILANPGGRAVYVVGLQSFACWDSRFESRREHGCLCFVIVVCCQVEVSASGCAYVQKVLPSVMCLIVIAEPHRGGIRPLRLSSYDKKFVLILSFLLLCLQTAFFLHVQIIFKSLLVYRVRATCPVQFICFGPIVM
jgi:hypothetical protein